MNQKPIDDAGRLEIIAQISDLHAKRGDDWVHRRAEAYLSCYWEDAVIFAVNDRLTLSELRRAYVESLDAGGGAVTIELPPVDDIAISVDGDAVTTIYTWRSRTISAEGALTDRVSFETDVWYRRNGIWKIVRMHLTHLSVTPVST